MKSTPYHHSWVPSEPLRRSSPFRSCCPLDTYRAPIERAASSALGTRSAYPRVAWALSIYPQIGISLSDVSIANPQGARHPQMVEVKSVVVGAKLMPLLSRRLEITEVVLQNPVIHLEVNRDGASNWQLGSPATRRRPGETNSRIASVGVGQLKVEGGEVTYDDVALGHEPGDQGCRSDPRHAAVDGDQRSRSVGLQRRPHLQQSAA